MASTEHKRFVYRSPNKKRTTYLVPTNVSRSKSIPTKQVLPSSPSQTVVNGDTSRTIETPARRVVVIRNTKYAQTSRRPINLGDFGQTDSEKNPSIINNGVSVFYRSI